MRLELANAAGRTRLAGCYQQVPLRVLPPFPLSPGCPDLMYLMNPTAGLMDGDGQFVELAAGPGTCTVVVGQSATRIHPCLTGFSTQQWRVRVDAGATLVLLPGPAIPFRGCRYYQRLDVDLAAGARFAYGDVWHAGRYARGPASEWFQFDTVVQELLIRRGGRLVYRDRFCWRGPWDAAAAAWHFGSAPACGSAFVTGNVADGLLAPDGDATRAVFATAAGDVCLRWHGRSAAVTRAVVQSTVQALTGQNCLATGDLAPCHWFSIPASQAPLHAVRPPEALRSARSSPRAPPGW